MSDYPIPKKETWFIVDSTKLSEYQRCPRSYFYKYILGWKTDSDQNHLWFGNCWHVAMEHLLLNGYSAQSILEAYRKFEEKYREKFPDYTDDLHFPRIPSVALTGLSEYCGKYIHDLNGYDVLYTEIAGTVPINEDRIVTFKMDAILRNKKTNQVLCREHKTTSRGGRAWEDKFKLSLQVGTYDHVMKCLFGVDFVEGVEINGAIFNKGDKRKGEFGVVKFQRIPIKRNAYISNAWLFNINKWYDEMEMDMLSLKECSDSAPIMTAFKQNTESCTDFWGCPYMDFCLTWSNPLQHTDQVPIGFIEEHWNPLEEDTIKTRMELLATK
jgi:hypothetical protein